MSVFVIEDELHAEWMGQFHSVRDAIAQLRRWASAAWDQIPNRAPCTGWRTCGRRYEIVEYDDRALPWQEVRRHCVLDVSASGVACPMVPKPRD